MLSRPIRITAVVAVIAAFAPAAVADAGTRAPTGRGNLKHIDHGQLFQTHCVIR
jgi:hypothetical protein